jgi:hypothetical protein
MAQNTYIKVDGVDLNVEWVKAMKRDEFIADPQVNRLFHRIPVANREVALSTIYQTVTGRKGRKVAWPESGTANDIEPVSNEN